MVGLEMQVAGAVAGALTMYLGVKRYQSGCGVQLVAATEPSDSFMAQCGSANMRALLETHAGGLLDDQMVPTPWLPSGMLQTVYCTMVGLKTDASTRVAYRRELLTLADQGTVSVDWHNEGRERVALVVPGLGGSSYEYHVRALAQRLGARGYTVAVMNHRGSGRTPLTSARLYNAYDTEDLAAVVRHVAAQPGVRHLVAVGYSLGANLLTKHLGEAGAGALIRAGVAVCCPFDTAVAGRALDARGWLNDHVFQPNLVATIKRLVKRNLAVFRAADLAYDLDAVMRATRMSQLDNLVTAPTYGHKDCWAYYAAASSAPYVAKVLRPLLALNTADDPITPMEGVPLEAVRRNPHVAVAVCRHGGHLGFFTGLKPRIWYLDHVATFLDAALAHADTQCASGADEGPRLATPADAESFAFPFAPYAIQLDFMQRLFEAIEQRSLGVFESPTGTGKSLSLLCGALTWLRQHEQRLAKQTEVADDPAAADKAGKADEPDWVRAYARRERQRKREDAAGERETRQRRYDAWVARTRRREAAAAGQGAARPNKRRRTDGGDGDDGLSDSDLLVADYRSGSDGSDGSSDADDSDGEPEEPRGTQIVFASRTHSQLQQLMGELKRTAHAQGLRALTLGGRSQLCAHPRERLRPAAQLNERCLAMQQTRAERCPLLPARRTPLLDFRAAAHAHGPADIEDLALIGRRLHVCAYYGARAAAPAAHLVAMPYNVLLSAAARQAMHVDLRGCVVVVDEAHNLVDAVLAVHSPVLDQPAVDRLAACVAAYRSRYWRRLSPENTRHVLQLGALLRALTRYMRGVAQAHRGAEGASVRVLRVNAFLHDARAEQFNVHAVARYLRVSQLGRKLNMFHDRHASDAAAGPPDAAAAQQGATSPAAAIAALESFIACIGSPERAAARVVVAADGGAARLKYLLLDPAEPFAEILRDARAVILAGGTMAPADDLVRQLRPADRPDDARLFSWPHVVDASHVCATVVASGPTARPLRFARADLAGSAGLSDAGLALAALCRVVPGGVVVFFPSYALLRRAHALWQESQVLARIEKAKHRVLAEDNSRTTGGAAEDILQEYSRCVAQRGGAVLLSVVGGRLSEGINFSDALGRAVVMVGLPFPNLGDAELRARLDYCDAKEESGDMGPRARAMYDALCMRAVNQSIGRAIRHRNDYAAIIFFDVRYAEPRIADKLPRWITDAGSAHASPLKPLPFGPALAQIAAFFKRDFASK
ncbi:ATP-dependent DNA helicase chl1 [Coemansia erecta]|uniref:ATP-dependent DNA helicase CHL1 n=1 Tax=Coemansia erecta TaxID=147472 RepID=A0A9W8CSQ9_9FUNG|nr:ATP-dependent DNA helicase chl1 [Coemansia erecta]